MKSRADDGTYRDDRDEAIDEAVEEVDESMEVGIPSRSGPKPLPKISIAVKEALQMLRPRNGFTSDLIFHYLKSNYSVHPVKTPRSIRSYLKRATDSGKILLVGGKGVNARYITKGMTRNVTARGKTSIALSAGKSSTALSAGKSSTARSTAKLCTARSTVKKQVAEARPTCVSGRRASLNPPKRGSPVPSQRAPTVAKPQKSKSIHSAVRASTLPTKPGHRVAVAGRKLQKST